MLHRLRPLLNWAAVLVGIWGGGNSANAESVVLAWDPSPDEWVVGYAIHYGVQSGVYVNRTEVGNVTNALIDGLQPGTQYFFVATAYTADGLESEPSNEVSYTVPSPPPDPTNEPPVVAAGPDQVVRLPGVAVLAGEASDDGLPGPLVVWWEMVTGPGAVELSATNALVVEARFSEPGLYVFRLVASDGQLMAADELQVVVEPPLPVNQAPVVRAGPNQTIELTDVAEIWGVVSDDGLPWGQQAIALRWEVVSGPGWVEFSEPASLRTQVRFHEPGQYILRLVASDGELQGSYAVTVTVVPPPSPDQYGLVWEAESGTAQGMILRQTGLPDSPTNAAAYVQAGSMGGPQMTQMVQVPESGTYVVWVRAASVDGASARLFLSVDGGTEVEGQLQPTDAQAWQWMSVRVVPAGGFYAPPGGTIPPVTLSMAAGLRTVSLRLADSRLWVDKLLITQSLEFEPLPPGMAAAQPVQFRGIGRRPDRMRLVWSSVPGAVYRLLYKDRWDDTEWKVASPDLMATGTEIVWKDEAAATAPSRFYRLQRLY